MIEKIILGLLLNIPFAGMVYFMVKDEGWHKTLKSIAIVIFVFALTVAGILKIISAFK